MKMKQDSGKPGETLSLVHADLLAKVDLFAQLDSVTLAKLAAYVEPFMIKNGATVCRQGDPGDCLFIIAKGKFGVFVSPLEGMGETRLSTMHPPEYFGEMALLTNDPRSATVRAEWEAEVLKLDRAHFLGLLKDQPAMGLSIISTLCRRLRTVSQTVAESNWVVGKTIDHVLSQLSAERRRYLFEASILDELSMPALHILFGPQAEMVAQDLAKIGIKEDKASIPILGVLRERFRREAGIKDFQIFAQEAASRLADAQAWDDALSVLSRYGQRSVFISFLGRALRAIPPLPRE
jgi:CRP-like cAMP-binding protein